MINKRILQCFLFVLLGFISFGLQAQNFWSQSSPEKSNQTPDEIIPYISEYSLFQLDYENIQKALKKSPEEFSKKTGKYVKFPMPNGDIEGFYVYHSPIMEPGLQAKYPNMRNYKVIGKDNPKLQGRIGVSISGFHASINTPEGRFYIDRYSSDSDSEYAVYYTKNYTKDQSSLPACGVSGTESEKYLEEFDLENIEAESGQIRTRTPEGDVTLRTYRCAIACTGEWGTVKGGTVESALAAVNQSVSKINEIFEYEVAIRMILVEDNDKLMHLNGATDPYQNPTQGAELIGQNTAAVSQIIGFGSFDIGHVYTVGCSDVGGIASLSSVCGAGKGNGVTCHYSSNIDLISVRVACHEMGHQFSAPHTFNHCDGENESTSSGYEPGSGHTIMSYAGGCGSALNVADAPYPYFHGHSVMRMVNFSQEGNGDQCASYIETSNTHPVITLPYTDGFYVPISTPLLLEASAEDAENDALTYSWEQFDLGPLTTPGEPVLEAPQFVSEVPNETPERFLPALTKILQNQYDKTEVLPFYDREFNFRLTVRDNNDEAGGSDWEEVQFFSTTTAGPFLVMYPNSTEDFVAGQKYNIEWDVANTDQGLVNSKFVTILLSVDGGLTYPKVLKSFTENDGIEEVVIPNSVTSFARVMVRSADNIFLDISNTNFKISEATEAGYSAVANPGYQQVCLPNDAIVEISTEQYLGYNESIEFEVLEGLPEGAVASFTSNNIQPGEITELVINGDNVVESGVYEILVRGIAGTDTVLFNTKVDMTSSDYSDLAVVYPAKGESSIPASPAFEWALDNDAETYIFELSDDPSFSGNGDTNVYEDDLTSNSFTPDEPLFKNKVYFWRVTGVNRCGVGFTTELSTFATEALSCREYAENAVPVNLPSSGTPTTELNSVVVTGGQVSDINVRRLKGTHNNFKELTATLVSPSGTEVVLFDKRCAGATSFNGGFDSESPIDIQCPITNGTMFNPEGDLTVFNGEDLIGTWILKIDDSASGNGGKVNEYVLDICSNASLSAPYLVTNTGLKTGPNQIRLINQGRLLVGDDDSDPDELTYTVVEAPEYGDMLLFTEVLEVGSTFTQADLNGNDIFYQSGADGGPVVDKFVFVVDDGEGGWVDLTTFEIELDIANGVGETENFAYDVAIFPNPSKDIVNVQINNLDVPAFSLQVTDVLGQVIAQETYKSTNSIAMDMQSYPKGNYFFRVIVNESSKVYKVSIQ